jgi:hypothetical protein
MQHLTKENEMLDWMKEFEFTNWMGIALYWVPASLCAYGYTVRTWLNYQKDVAKREEAEAAKKDIGRYLVYYPTDTVGTLIGRAVATVCPVANLWAASFDVAPKMFASFFQWIGRVFDAPLVPRRDA